MKRSTLSALVLASLLLISAYSVTVLAAKPPKAALTVTITDPSDGIEVENGGSFTVSGNVISKRGDAGTVETFVQYAKGEGSTDFADVDGTDLQIIAGEQPQMQVLLQDESYYVSWMLTGDPGTYEVRIFSQGSTAKSGASESRTVTIQGSAPPPPPPGIETIDAEYQDPDIGFGTSSGTYADTYVADGVYEVLSEDRNRQGTKKPVDDTTELGWIFEFHDLSERDDTSLHIFGRAEFTPDDTDKWFHVQIEYCSNWYTVLNIGGTAYDELYSVELPDDQCTTIRIRILDDDATIGNKKISSLHIDHMYLSNDTCLVGMDGPEILIGGYWANFTLSAWENSPEGWRGDAHFPTENAGWGFIGDVAIVDIDGDGQLETVIGNSDYIQVFENINGAMIPVHTIFHPKQIRSLAFGNLDDDEDPNLEILASFTNFDVQSVVFKMIDGVYCPVFNITSEGPRSTGGSACSVGDVDNDGDLEFIVSEEFPTSGGWSLIRLFDYDSLQATWINIANYTFELATNNWIRTVQIIDADNDGFNEILVKQDNTPVQLLEFSDGNLVNVWTEPHNRVHVHAPIAGDITNDGFIDIVVPDSYNDVFIVYETVGDAIVNTFNISIPDFHSCGSNSLAIGDIDEDGINELVILYMKGTDPNLDGFLGIFRNGLCVFEQPTGYEGRSVALGDYDNDALGSIASEATVGSDGIDSQTSGLVIAAIPVKKQE